MSSKMKIGLVPVVVLLLGALLVGSVGCREEFQWGLPEAGGPEGPAPPPLDGAATLVVAASNSSDSGKSRASYVCDGADDQVEIQAALDTGNVGVLLLEGTFYISSDIGVGEGDTLVGQGYSTVLKVPDGNNSDINIVNVGGSFAVLSNLRIDGNRGNQSSGSQTGVNIAIGDHIKITTLWIHHIYGGNGIFAPVPNKVADLLIQGCTVENVRDDGMDVNGIIHSVVTDNYIANCGDNGIDTEGSKYTTFSNNVILNCSGNGLEIEEEGEDWAEYCTVTGNTIYNSGFDGVHVGSGRFNTITGNTIRSSGRNGVLLVKTKRGGNSDHNVISSNIIIDGSDAGICEVAGQADYNLITGNIFHNNGGDRDIIVNGQHTQATGNLTERD